jgi:hypothetical protein
MKKLIVVMAIFFATMQVSAIELLDGFTTDMGINDVRQRARVQVRPRRDEQIFTKANMPNGLRRESYFNIFEGNKEYLNSQFPVIETVIQFESSLQVLYRMDGIANYWFHFYRDKLFAIQMRFSNNRTDNLLRDFTNVYGNSYVTIDQKTDDREYLWRTHIWETAERTLFLSYSAETVSSAFVYYVDRRNINFSAEKAR